MARFRTLPQPLYVRLVHLCVISSRARAFAHQCLVRRATKLFYIRLLHLCVILPGLGTWHMSVCLVRRTIKLLLYIKISLGFAKG